MEEKEEIPLSYQHIYSATLLRYKQEKKKKERTKNEKNNNNKKQFKGM